MNPPVCQWSRCKRVMKLVKETEEFWSFVCDCGCVRALSKPSVRNKSMRDKEQREIDELIRSRKIRDARVAYSFSNKVN